MTSSSKEGNSGAVCPSCERFIGPADVCPYCGADSARSPVFRVLRWGAITLAAAGLVFLYLMTAHKEVEVMKIGGITPAMNFAHVRVAGVTESDAFIGRKQDRVDYVSFVVSDETGRLQVQAYREIARDLADKKLLPPRGARVEVTGALRVSGDGKIRLYLNSADHLRVAALPAPGSASEPRREDRRLRDRRQIPADQAK